MNLAARYNEMQKNGRLLSNRAAVEIIDVRIRQLVDRLDENETPQRVANLYKLWGNYVAALDADMVTEAAVCKRQISEEFDKIHTDYLAWSQMFEALEYRRKMTESEVKILKEIKAVITYEDMYEMQAKVLAAAIRVVGDDPRKLRQLQYEFAKIAGESGGTGFSDDEDDQGGGEPGRGEERSRILDEEKLLHPGDEEPPYIEG